MSIIGIVAPVAVGALIGYCTNYIAIKMLFRPRTEVRIGTWKLTFTPGVIPRNKARIAKAVGNAVSEHLVTEEDMVRRFKESDLKARFVQGVMQGIEGDSTWETYVDRIVQQEHKQEVFDKSVDFIYEKVIAGIKNLDLAEIITNVSQDSFSDLLQNPMIAMFINENTIQMLAGKLGDGVSDYMDAHGRETIYPIVKNKAEEFMNQTVKETMEGMDICIGDLEAMLGRLYDRVAEGLGGKVVQTLSVQSMVEDRINEMDVADLEELVMSVMKQELQTVINLGAGIGAIIGILNIFF